MNRYVMEEFYNDPGLRRRLFEKAQRERSRAVRGGFAWLQKKLKAHLLPHFNFSRPNWLERLG